MKQESFCNDKDVKSTNNQKENIIHGRGDTNGLFEIQYHPLLNVASSNKNALPEIFSKKMNVLVSKAKISLKFTFLKNFKIVVEGSSISYWQSFYDSFEKLQELNFWWESTSTCNLYGVWRPKILFRLSGIFIWRVNDFRGGWHWVSNVFQI